MQLYFGQECHFNNIFYNSLGINSLEKLSNFLERCCISCQFWGKITIGFRSILVVNSVKNNNLFWKCKFFGYVSFTGKSENLAKTPIFKEFFSFL